MYAVLNAKNKIVNGINRLIILGGVRTTRKKIKRELNFNNKKTSFLMCLPNDNFLYLTGIKALSILNIY